MASHMRDCLRWLQQRTIGNNHLTGNLYARAKPSYVVDSDLYVMYPKSQKSKPALVRAACQIRQEARRKALLTIPVELLTIRVALTHFLLVSY